MGEPGPGYPGGMESHRSDRPDRQRHHQPPDRPLWTFPRRPPPDHPHRGKPTKPCTKCNVDQPLSEYWKSGSTHLEGRHSICRTCKKAAWRAWRDAGGKDKLDMWNHIRRARRKRGFRPPNGKELNGCRVHTDCFTCPLARCVFDGGTSD